MGKPLEVAPLLLVQVLVLGQEEKVVKMAAILPRHRLNLRLFIN